MTIGSLFAGIGAFDLGFQQAGFETLWQVEIDRHCQKLLKGKFPKAKRTLDVRRFNPDKNECPDVITFGSPCQDLSVAGQRSGINGERSGLFFHATRIIRGFVGRGLQFALWENVPGVLNSNGPRDFAAVLGTLAQCGAVDIGWRILDCQWFGLAQRRKRVFLVADFGGRRAAEILSLAQSLQRDTAPSRETGQRVAPTVGSRADRSGCNEFATSGGLAEVAPTLDANHNRKFGCDQWVDNGFAIPIPMTAQPFGSHHRRDDLDNDTYVPLAFTIHGTDKTQRIASETDLAGCVRTKPPGSQENSSTTVVAFSSKDSGQDAGSIAPTLRSQNFKDSHMNGGGQVAIAFDTTQVTSRANYSNPKNGDPCHPLASGAHAPALCATITKNYATHHGRTAGNNGGIAEGQLIPIETHKPHGMILSYESDKAYPNSLLFALRNEIGEKAFSQWCVGILILFYTKEILQSALHGSELRPTPFRGDWQVHLSSPRQKGRIKGVMLTLWTTDGRGRSSQGQGCPQQLLEELGAYLSELSQPGTQREKVLYDLWKASEGIGVLRQALSAIQDAWKSTRIQAQPAQSDHSVRRLTPEECEFLMGLPRGWTAGFSDSVRYRMIGNSLAVPVAKWIAERIAKLINP